GVSSTEIADLAGEESLGGNAFLFRESRHCKVVGSDLDINCGGHKAVGSHDNIRDTWTSDLLTGQERNYCGHPARDSRDVERGKGAVVLYQVPHCFRSRQQAGCPNRVGSVRVRASKNLTELLNRNEGTARF